MESAQEWRDESNRKAREIEDLQQKDILDLQQNMDALDIKCLKYTKKWRYVVVCYVWILFALVLALLFLLQKSIRSLLLHQIINVTRPTVGVQQWSEWLTNMVIKLLTHRTPP